METFEELNLTELSLSDTQKIEGGGIVILGAGRGLLGFVLGEISDFMQGLGEGFMYMAK